MRQKHVNNRHKLTQKKKQTHAHLSVVSVGASVSYPVAPQVDAARHTRSDEVVGAVFSYLMKASETSKKLESPLKR